VASSPGVGEQDADVAVGLVVAGAGRAEGGQDGIGGLPGAGYGGSMRSRQAYPHERTWIEFKDASFPEDAEAT
jgi:hypothetical protein